MCNDDVLYVIFEDAACNTRLSNKNQASGFGLFGSSSVFIGPEFEIALVGHLGRENDMCGETENITSNLELINERRNVSS